MIYLITLIMMIIGFRAYLFMGINDEYIKYHKQCRFEGKRSGYYSWDVKKDFLDLKIWTFKSIKKKYNV